MLIVRCVGFVVVVGCRFAFGWFFVVSGVVGVRCWYVFVVVRCLLCVGVCCMLFVVYL